MEERVAKNWVGGAWVEGGPPVAVRSPADPSDLVGTYHEATAELVAQAVAAARDAQRGWRRLGAVARGQLLYQAAEAVAREVETLAALASREMGKPLGEARGEALRAVHILRYYAGEGARAMGEVIPATQPQVFQYTRREPLGVVGVITPWNFPLAIPAWKIAPALVYGNTVVFKPAEWASLTAAALVACLAPLLPPGVLNLVMGPGRTVGDALVRAPAVDGVTFTGSVATGAAVAAVSAGRGAKYQLEMGGKNPVIVLSDANLDAAVELTVSGAFRSAGQKCTATSRVIVERSVYAAFRERLVRRTEALKVGHPLEADTYLGPVVSEPQWRKVRHYIETGMAEAGAPVVGGLAVPGGLPGYYVAPTIFDRVAPTATIAQEEIFGPVVALMEAADVDEAIQLANRTPFGLSASVFTNNLSRALHVVEELEAGLVRVNEETAGVELQAPFGGMKASSSHSREQGRAAIEFFTTTKTVALRPVD
ncbi:MAG: aldehyde dehydrogenase family protein [Firmicutes bacterium]|nr:aldehyde dehydrogenase family protein [Bacillota bacterium]